jgi:ABC-type phosphate transport system substrate-binding protein
MVTRKVVLASALAVASALGAQRIASAADCSTLPNPVYISGSSAIQPFVRDMGKALVGNTTLVYQSAGSCVGVASVLNDTTPTGACVTGACITGNGTFFDATGAAQTCTLPAAGQHVDVGVSDVFATSCSGVTSVPATIKDFTGPIQAMLFVVPKASTQTALTAEEGYFVFGFGGAAGMVNPWLDVAFQIIRNIGSGTQQMTSRAVGVPAAKMKGTDAGGSGGVVTMVSTSTSAEKTIGILAADQYDKKRDVLAALAFQSFHQWNAYYADSTATSLDKKNVRDGHYSVWGPLHMLVQVNANTGVPLSAAAKTFIDWVQGTPTTPAAPFDITDIITTAGVVPACAMTVQRSTEMGPMSKFSPTEPCGCYFENKANGATTCTACTGTGQGTCATAGQVCRRGFCESH